MRSIPVLLVVGAVAGALGSGTRPADAQWFSRHTLQVEATAPAPGDGKKALNTISEVFGALDACWIPPDLDESRAGMQITVMVAFKRSGELLGKPRITYETPSATDAERATYRTAMAQALARCLPLHFTEALGNALAGRPMTLRFIDNRKLKQAGRIHDRAS